MLALTLRYFLVDGVGHGQGTQDFAGDEDSVFGVADFAEQHDEFVAALTADGVGAAHATGDAAGHGLQQFVADGVAVHVVNFFEEVEIDEHDGELFAVAVGKGDGLLDAVVEQDPIGQVGEKVVLREVGEFESFGAGGADVVENGDGAGDVAGAIVGGGGGMLDGDFRAIAALQGAVAGEVDIFFVGEGGDQAFASGTEFAAVDEAENFFDRVADGFRTRPAGEFFGGGIEIDDTLGAIADDHRFASASQGGFGALLLEEGGFFLGALADEAVNHAAQTEMLNVGAEDVVAGAVFGSFFGEMFIFGIADDQDGNVRGGVEEFFEGGHGGGAGLRGVGTAQGESFATS